MKIGLRYDLTHRPTAEDRPKDRFLFSVDVHIVSRYTSEC